MEPLVSVSNLLSSCQDIEPGAGGRVWVVTLMNTENHHVTGIVLRCSGDSMAYECTV